MKFCSKIDYDIDHDTSRRSFVEQKSEEDILFQGDHVILGYSMFKHLPSLTICSWFLSITMKQLLDECPKYKNNNSTSFP